jgi:uncharacterized protein (TIGR00730 family)
MVEEKQKNFNPNDLPKEIEFLEGPHSRWKDLLYAFDVFSQFIKGFRKLHFVGPCVTVFGSARFKEGHPYYELARKMGGAISELGFTVMTGGGPGIMEAANRGAKEAGGRSVGCNIVLPVEQEINPYLDKWVKVRFFFVRKALLSKYSYAFVVMPGGYGTLDEFFEAITLIQTGKFRHFPIVMMGKEYHKDLYEHVQKMMSDHTIGNDDINLFLLTDSVEEAKEHIRKNAIDVFGLKKEGKVKPFLKPLRWLKE